LCYTLLTSKTQGIHMHPSNSKPQQNIEVLVLDKIGLTSKKIKIDNKEFNFDGFSDEDGKMEIVEIYAGIDKLKSAQQQKVSQDLLKMYLYEKLSEKKFNKRFIVIDQKIYEKLDSERPWKNLAFETLGITLEYVDIGEDNLEKLRQAKKGQNLLNQIA